MFVLVDVITFVWHSHFVWTAFVDDACCCCYCGKKRTRRGRNIITQCTIRIDSTDWSDLNPTSYSQTFFFTRLMTGGLLQTEDQPCDIMLSAYHTALGADMGRNTMFKIMFDVLKIRRWALCFDINLIRFQMAQASQLLKTWQLNQPLFWPLSGHWPVSAMPEIDFFCLSFRKMSI